MRALSLNLFGHNGDWPARRAVLDGVSIAYRDCWESVHGAEPGLTFEPRNP